MPRSSLCVLAVLAAFTLPRPLAGADPTPVPPDAATPSVAPAEDGASTAPLTVVPRSVLSQSGLSNVGDVTQSLGMTSDTGSRRGIASDYLVMPSGGELTGAMHFVTTNQPALGADRLRFSDLALLELAAR